MLTKTLNNDTIFYHQALVTLEDGDLVDMILPRLDSKELKDNSISVKQAVSIFFLFIVSKQH